MGSPTVTLTKQFRTQSTRPFSLPSSLSLSLSLSSTQLHGIAKFMPRYAYSLLACFNNKAHITVKQ
jgi:hypothetical protein